MQADTTGHSSPPLRTKTGRVKKAKKGLRVHSCATCGKVYTRNEHLRRHQMLHAAQGESSSAGQTSIGSVDCDTANPFGEASSVSQFPSFDMQSGPDQYGGLSFSDFYSTLRDDEDVNLDSELVAILDRTSAATLTAVDVSQALSVDEVAAIGRTFQETLRNDFHYHQLIGRSASLPSIANGSSSNVLVQWRRMLKLLEKSHEDHKRRQKSKAYQMVSWFPTDHKAQIYLDTFWEKLHPNLLIFDGYASFQRSMSFKNPALWLMVMALGAATCPTLLDQQRAVLFAEDAVSSLNSDATLSMDGLSIGQIQAITLVDVYSDFYQQFPNSRNLQFVCEHLEPRDPIGSSPAQVERLQRLRKRLHLIRSSLLLPPRRKKTTWLPTDSSTSSSICPPLEVHILDLAVSTPLRPLLIVTGQSFLNGRKVSQSVYHTSQRDIRAWAVRETSQSGAKHIARKLLAFASINRDDLMGCPWRDRAVFLACLTLWAVNYARGEGLESAMGEVSRLLGEVQTREGWGWLKTDMMDTLETIEARGREKGWF
ncbi:hypothetical protein ANO11243_037800 [Dothideomycetidae sp. 11243]|nr:hypothetical protein ANO11243_037800 [fungal sp. No.11243]